MHRFRRLLLLTTLLVLATSLTELWAQSSPAITSWLINTNGTVARSYRLGNPTPIVDTAKANVQLVRYNATSAYINCSGLPSYITGPFNPNPAVATNNKNLFRIPLVPQPKTGTKTAVGMGNIGILINGVPIYNYADAFSYNNQNVWHQNAIVFENSGFDCSKAHPSPVRINGVMVGGNYHHHQNPSAFSLSTNPTSTVCSTYPSDGLYVPDSTRHSPLIGFAFDGYPIYGPYGYDLTTGTGPVVRIRPSYRLRNITARTSLPNGTALAANQYGPTLATYALGAYKEDFEYVASSGHLDESNGRFAVTPEYPQGTYAYYATIEANGRSAFPYFIGDNYYGVVANDNFARPGSTTTTSVVAPTTGLTTYVPTAIAGKQTSLVAKLYPNPAADFVAVQVDDLMRKDATVELITLDGKTLLTTTLTQGSTIAYLDTRTIYDGIYLVRVSSDQATTVIRLVLNH